MEGGRREGEGNKSKITTYTCQEKRRKPSQKKRHGATESEPCRSSDDGVRRMVGQATESDWSTFLWGEDTKEKEKKKRVEEKRDLLLGWYTSNCGTYVRATTSTSTSCSSTTCSSTSSSSSGSSTATGAAALKSFGSCQHWRDLCKALLVFSSEFRLVLNEKGMYHRKTLT